MTHARITGAVSHGRVRRREQTSDVTRNRNERELRIVVRAPSLDAIAAVVLGELLEARVCREDRVDRAKRVGSELPMLFHCSECGCDGGSQVERRRKKTRLG